MSIIFGMFSDFTGFFKTIGNRASNKSTKKGLLVIALTVGADFGMDVGTIERLFDGASLDSLEGVVVLCVLIAYHYLIKEDKEDDNDK